MRFASFLHESVPRYGLVVDETVFLVEGALRAHLPTLKDAIAADALARVADEVRRAGTALPLASLRFAPTIPNPGKIICVGLNYRAHGDEKGRPEHPAIFTRFADTQTGHDGSIRVSAHSQMLDFEAEVALVIGMEGRDIAQSDALRYVAGYSCYNDATMRDWQRHSTQYTAGKNFPSTGAFGPWLVTADEVGDPHDLTISCSVNGERLQHASTADMLFTFEEIIAYISRFTPLSPGDVLVTGTPAGAGSGRKPPRFLAKGDVVTVSVDRVGTLINTVE
jgi:2-keto-4-pentenoate hydratase/2-oxohepta-3-ene-1,7-dioic acid hydratase in catechol pathway